MNMNKDISIIKNPIKYWQPSSRYCIIETTKEKRKNMTIQVQNTVRRLVARHGYSATFVQHMGEGIVLYSIGGIMYRIRGDGTILWKINVNPCDVRTYDKNLPANLT
jgi:hypothetical protein